MHPDRAAAAVDDAVSRLRERFGSFPLVETEWVVTPDTYDRTAERAAAHIVGGAGAWVRRDREGTVEALLVREADKGGWSEPAGKQEPGERLGVTACRETYEETGVECRLTGVLRAERAVHVVEGPEPQERPPLPRLVVVFDADHLCGEPRPGEPGIDEAAWLTSHPDELAYPGVAEFPIE
ncbi:MAG: NUDIX domain-containing protein [Halolamina sp.]